MQRPVSRLGDRLCLAALGPVRNGGTVRLSYDIQNSDRAVGARLGGMLAREFGTESPPGRVAVDFSGAAGQVVACWPQDHERTAGHVLGCMLSDALDDSYRAAVAYGKPLAGPPGAEELATGCAIEDCVAEKVRITRIVFGRADNDPATPHPLADVVVGLAG